MPKTRRDLLIAIAEKIGGERGKRMLQALEHCEFPHLMDRPISDAEFERHLKNAERDLPGVLAKDVAAGHEVPDTWGFPN